MTNRFEDLTALFGPESRGTTPQERARTSNIRFVRSQLQLAEWSEGATGRILTASEALEDHGLDKIREAIQSGSAVICDSPSTAGENLRTRRETLGLQIDDVARAARLPEADVAEAERTRRDVPIHRRERIARALGLDDRWISNQRAGEASDRLAARLRVIGNVPGARMSPAAVLTFAEAAWIGATQVRLEERLGLRPNLQPITPRAVYHSHPAYEQGYTLAQETRRLLGLGEDALPRPLHEICDEVIGIPVVQAELPKRIAGATVASGTTRTLVINTNGKNSNVWVRRSTYAHELCHILWDQASELHDVHVDEYKDVERDLPDQAPDRIEQRANAFSVELIAPQAAVLSVFRAHGGGRSGLRAVMEHFDVSFTPARYQVRNGDQTVPLESLVVDGTEPPVDAIGRESYTADYFPIADVPLTRRGRFAAVVVRAMEEGLISDETAAEFLFCSRGALRDAGASMRDLFPTVWVPR